MAWQPENQFCQNIYAARVRMTFESKEFAPEAVYIEQII